MGEFAPGTVANVAMLRGARRRAADSHRQARRIHQSTARAATLGTFAPRVRPSRLRRHLRRRTPRATRERRRLVATRRVAIFVRASMWARAYPRAARSAMRTDLTRPPG